MQKIGKRDIHMYFAALREKGLSSNTVRKHYDLLKSIFLSAEQGKKVAKSPMRVVAAPKKEKFESKIYTLEQVLTLFDAMENDRLEVAVKLVVLMGLRRGEVCGLRWGHVHFDTGIIEIVESRTQAGKEYIEGDVKSEASERKLVIPGSLLPVLKRVKEQQEQDKRDLGDMYQDEDFVFAWPDGRPYRPNYLSDMFKDFLQKKGLPHIRYHDLRHTFGSIAVGKAPLRDVSKAMGHHREGFTEDVYLKDLEDTRSVAVNAVEDILQATRQRIRDSDQHAMGDVEAGNLYSTEQAKERVQELAKSQD